MANEVEGGGVPDALVERMRRQSSADAGKAEGIAIAREIAAELRDQVQGLQVSSPSGDVDSALAVLDGLR